jgi:hypothetical protein
MLDPYTDEKLVSITTSISTGAHYVTPDSKIYCEKVKICQFSSGKWFFCTKFVHLAVASKGATQLCTSKKECDKLNLIGPGDLLLVVPTYMQFHLQLLVGLPKKNS